MPNQRAKGKKIVGAWVDDETVVALDKLAKAHNVPRAEIIKAIIKKGISNEGTDRKSGRVATR